jgi:hypothetical protein
MGAVLIAGSMFKLVSYNDQHLLGQKPTPCIWLNLIICIPAMFMPFILLSLPRFVFGWLSHLSEEIAWRGYLLFILGYTSRADRYGHPLSCIFSGICSEVFSRADWRMGNLAYSQEIFGSSMARGS